MGCLRGARREERFPRDGRQRWQPAAAWTPGRAAGPGAAASCLARRARSRAMPPRCSWSPRLRPCAARGGGYPGKGSGPVTLPAAQPRAFYRACPPAPPPPHPLPPPGARPPLRPGPGRAAFSFDSSSVGGAPAASQPAPRKAPARPCPALLECPGRTR